jgi:hypothetical protein
MSNTDGDDRALAGSGAQGFAIDVAQIQKAIWHLPPAETGPGTPLSARHLRWQSVRGTGTFPAGSHLERCRTSTGFA